MFGWFKSKRSPQLPSASNQERAITTGADGAITASAMGLDIVNCLAEVLKAEGHAFEQKKFWIELSTGLVVQPQLAGFKEYPGRGVQSGTTITVSCPQTMPDGVFEFQHASGKTLAGSIAQGFKDWMNLDLPVLLDSQLVKPVKCKTMEFKFPAEEGKPARRRRALLGPVAHYTAQASPEAAEHPPFCPCCLFSNSAQAFVEKVGGDGFFAVRFYAARDASGVAQADCRVNGLDFQAGKEALLDYVTRWETRGVEFRKQYVIIQNSPA